MKPILFCLLFIPFIAKSQISNLRLNCVKAFFRLQDDRTNTWSKWVEYSTVRNTVFTVDGEKNTICWFAKKAFTLRINSLIKDSLANESNLDLYKIECSFHHSPYDVVLCRHSRKFYSVLIEANNIQYRLSLLPLD